MTLRRGDQRPVMVWIHGGSYVFGAGDAAIYDARALVEEQNVIVVSITIAWGCWDFSVAPAGAPRTSGCSISSKRCAG